MSENGNNGNNGNENRDVKEEKRNVNRTENPGMVVSTFIKYAAYIIILLIVLYFLVTYIFPKI